LATAATSGRFTSFLPVRHAADVPLDQLAWNRLDARFWFHYTTVYASRLIVGQGRYVVGGRSRPGLYVSDLAPGALSDQDMLNALLDGTRELERVQAAVVLADDPALAFVREGRSAWVHAAPAGTRLDLADVVVGRAFQRDGLWRYDETLWAA
jgi:hypothetical protein